VGRLRGVGGDGSPAARQRRQAGREFAPVKINLALHVTGRRDDGYHLINSLVVFAADVGDTISLAIGPAGAPMLRLRGRFAAALSNTDDRDNLAMRAAGLMTPEAGFTITIDKRIPVSAGLGGGSADAAAVLRLLNGRRRPPLEAASLARLALGLGADVPMCLASRPLLAHGVGEEITPIDGMPALPMVLACPPVTVPTAAVFAAFDHLARPHLPRPPAFANVRAVAEWLDLTRNDLAAPAGEIEPEAAAAAQALAADGECLFARMSGSGAAAFGLFPSRAAAARGAARLATARPSWWVKAAISGPAPGIATGAAPG
jgi:4-diphosphocytidyl-2-C-methyl-D-erythritol kinase